MPFSLLLETSENDSNEVSEVTFIVRYSYMLNKLALLWGVCSWVKQRSAVDIWVLVIPHLQTRLLQFMRIRYVIPWTNLYIAYHG